MNLIEVIKISKKNKASSYILTAFSGPPKQRDPTHVKLRETGWLFHLPFLLLIKTKNLPPKSDLVQESFLKNFEKVPGYKASFDFKNKMFPLLRSQRTSLISLYKLRDVVTRVKIQVDDT